MDELGKKRCPRCDYENDQVSVQCVNCGAALNVTTIASPELATIADLEPLAQPAALDVNEVVFVIAGQPRPIVIRREPGQVELSIGRSVPGEAPPTLDLANAGQTAASVSRRHALLDFSGEHPILKDLNSTNSTWVNENLLQPFVPYTLRNGDLIRFGQQYVFIYFSTGVEPEKVVVLTETEKATPYLTPHLLSHHIIGYLQTLADIHHILAEVAQRDAARVLIKKLDVAQSPYITRALIAGGQETIRSVMDIIGPWRRMYAEFLDQPVGLSTERLKQEMQQLADAMLDGTASTLAPDQRVAYTEQLLPHIQTIALHSLELSLDWEW